MTGPVFAHGQLRLYLLALLARSPQHGYDLIKGLTDQFGGTYRPSPGTIYPRLARLEEEGLIEKDKGGRKSVYRITQAGRDELAARSEELVETEGEIASTVRQRADQLRRETLAGAQGLAEQIRQGPGSGATTWVTQPAGLAPGPAEQVAARARLKQAETFLTLFRAEARAELRLRAAQGALSEDALLALRRGLDQTLAALKATA